MNASVSSLSSSTCRLFSLLLCGMMLSAMGSFQPAAAQVDLTLDSSRTEVEIQPDGQATTTVTFTLSNVGSEDTSGVATDVTVPSELTVEGSTPSTGSYSSGTWENVDVAASASETLDLTVSTSGPVPRDLGAALAGNATVSTQARVVPVPYGSGSALAFDGSGDYVAVPNDPSINNTSFRKRTIEVWFRADELNSGSRQVIYEEGGGRNGLNIFINGNGALRAGAWSSENIWEGDWFQTSAVEENTWHHAVLVYDNRNNTMGAYLDGEQFGSTSPSADMPSHNPLAIGAQLAGSRYDESNRDFGRGKFFNGHIDLVRIWDGALTQREIQARAHRTIDLDGTAADSLIAAFRLDTGSGSTVYDVAGFNGTFPDGSFGGNPQWIDPSGASAGRTSTVLTDSNSPVTEGPSGSSIEGTLTSGTGLANDATLYRWGDAGEPLVTDPADGTERSNVAWGLWNRGTAEADATISYGNVQGLTTDGSEPVQLLRRPAADARWTSITSNSNVSHSTSNDQFTVTGVTGRYQYAVANAPEVELALDSSRTETEIQPDGQATTDVTFTLSNNDSSTDASGVTVAVDVPSGLSVSSSSAGGSTSYSSGTWDVGSLSSGGSVQLTLTLTLSGETPQDVTATLSDLDKVADRVQTSARVVPVPYGSEQALAFDGSGDYLTTGTGGDNLGLVNESFSIGVWVKPNSVDTRALVGMVGNTDNETLGLVLKPDEKARFVFYGNDLASPAGVINTGAWQHLMFVYDASTGDRFIYHNGEQVANDNTSTDFQGTGELLIGRWSGGNYFDGLIDQVRVWQGALSQQQVQARAHRTVDLDGSVASDLLAAYRFDVGNGDRAHDVGGGDGTYADASFQGDPQWTSPSGASVGRTSTVLTDSNSPVTEGPSGSSIEGTLTSGSGLTDDATVYRWGQESGSVVSGESFPFGVSERSAVAWGLWPRGSAGADATISYGDVSGLVTDGSEAVRLLQRAEPGAGWTDVTDSSAVSADPSNNQFSISGSSGRYQYAVANAQEVDLTLSASPPTTDVAPNGSEEATVTLTLTHANGTIDATGVEVSVSAEADVTITGSAPSTGSYSSGTWSVGTVSPGTSETLELTVTLAGAVPQDLSGSLSAIDQMDSDGASVSARVLRYPYGSGQALSFDGTDDYVAVPNDPSINTNGPYPERTIELWFRADDISKSSEQVLYEEGGSGNGFNVYLNNGTLYAGGWSRGNNWSGDWLSTSVVKSGTWHHVALVFDQPDGHLRAYLDGARFGDKVPGSVMSTHGDEIAIGQNRDATRFATGADRSTGERFAGQIDQIRLWDTALTAEQVQARSRRTMDLDGAKVGDLLLAYRFEAGSGNTVHDAAGFGGQFRDGSATSSVTAADRATRSGRPFPAPAMAGQAQPSPMGRAPRSAPPAA